MVKANITEKENKNYVSGDTIKKKIYEKFLEPTTKNKKEYIGIEIEIPIINLNKKAVDFEIVHKTISKFNDEFESFEVEGIDYDGNIFSLKDNTTGDVVCFDCSYNNIEFAMGKEENLFVINERFKTYFKFIKDELETYNHTLTGMGINPYKKYNNEIPIPNERYLMLYHHLKTYPKFKDKLMYFHKYPDYGMFSSASQVQLDVPYEELIDTINIFSKLEPIKALLFSNSVLIDENEEYTCFRDNLWEYSTHGINPHNIGMYEKELENSNELINYIQSLYMYCVKRNDIYINFEPISLEKYLKKESIIGEYYDNGEYKQIEITPELEDISYLRPFKFINITFRGTIEYRSICTQPIKDSMTVAAFHVGLKNMLSELNEILNDSLLYKSGYTPTELRKLFIKDEIPPFIDEDNVYELTRNILDLAKKGLENRNMGEEIFLEPLYDRMEKRTNPGKDLIKSLNQNVSIEYLIKEYGKLN